MKMEPISFSPVLLTIQENDIWKEKTTLNFVHYEAKGWFEICVLCVTSVMFCGGNFPSVRV